MLQAQQPVAEFDDSLCVQAVSVIPAVPAIDDEPRLAEHFQVL